MARKTTLKCPVGAKRFTVLRINQDDRDTFAARSYEAARAAANPDRGSRIDVFVTCARDAGEARLASNFKKVGRLVRTQRAKR